MNHFYLYFLIFIITINPPLVAELLSPENGAILNHLHVLFEWEQEPITDYYEIQISENSSFSNTIVQANNQTLVFIEQATIEWEKTYYWRIRAMRNNGMALPWTNSFSFSTGSPLSETTTTISIANQIQDGITVFGAFFNYFSAAIDVTGREIWNSGNENLVYYSTSEFGDVFGCELVSGSENNLPGKEFTFEGETIWEEPNDEFLHHDLIKLPNGNYLGIVETSAVGPIPIGDWTPLFQGLGFQADGVTMEFIWIGDKLMEWDNETGDVVWEWSVFDHFSMMDYDQFGGTWSQAYIDLHYDWTHVNAVIFDEIESAIYFSTRHLSRITKLDYPSGDIIWNLGHEMPSGQVTLGNEIGFSFQHSLQILNNGNIITFDNGNLAPEFRGTDDPQSRAIELAISQNNADLVWSYELPDDLFGFASGNAQKMENGNVMVTTVGGGGRSLEVNSNGNIVWEANYNLSLPSGAVYRAHRIPGLFPAAYSVMIDNFLVSGENQGVYLPSGSSEISFTLHNESEYDLALSFSLSDQADWFGNQSGEIELFPNQIETITFTGNVTESSNGNPITLIVTSEYHPEKEKTTLVNGFTFPLSTESEPIPHKFELFPAFPNPFNPKTTIQYNVQNSELISLKVLDISGRVVETLFEDIIESGNHETKWNAKMNPSGIYFVKLTSGQKSETQKILFLK
ncbi:MAG: T9SS type A sorting domain-containing protein [Candidatus Marinimicrobia bacterium]|nr:T9SS type A sorting domain-containing protein [Candidatus Neomarinimicrobiota bacterium]MBT6796635.1 T9SS type A sorting domain-containing protein [Candidatus Neomarinimicrobiota bacterium]MBT6866662.1 T9SS type A sorting domain-containing protein [Candidatus Neomarinimicrobiota bacterium]MBT7043326.1 T9SS type A sorting domain-containing protein [Candidatus Neomarinimicrobiota bacterium]